MKNVKPNVRAALAALRHVRFCEVTLDKARAALDGVVCTLTEEEMIQYMRESAAERKKERDAKATT